MSESTSKGFEAWPPLYQDEKRLSTLADDNVWTDMMLYDRIVWYQGFLKHETKLMPNGKARAERNLSHMKFERDCRLGKYAVTLFEEPQEIEGVEDEQKPEDSRD